MHETARNLGVRLVAALALLTLATCGGDDTGGASPADSGADAATDGGACIAGEPGCPCTAARTCQTGECVSGTCVDCTRGAEGCVCRSNGACNGALRCVDGACEACQAGTEDCSCAPNDECQGELACMDGVCAEPSCVPGDLDCPCRPDDPRCEGDAVCDANEVCRACSTDMPGCPCEDGACSGGLVCDGDSCREAVTCDDLVDDGDCDAHQTCEQPSGADATCVPESCDSGYRWVSGLGCMKCQQDDCSDGPTCSGPNSIADQCAAAFKQCDDSSGSAVCGACLPNTVANGDRCVPEILCGSAACDSDEYCDTDDDTCKALPCPKGQAQDTLGNCSACSLACSGAGLTGRIWPFRTADDSCICETAPGYYMPPGGTSDPELCDADGDGWVREEADDSVIRNSAALRHNSRCDIRLVDTVMLFDEYGLSLEVGSCVEGLIKNPDGTNCTGRVNMRLLETQRNDVPGKPDAASGAPKYGDRLLEAEELTGLTKFCVNLLGDYNDDGQEDITEIQETPTDLGATADDQRRLRSFAFFGELYRSYYQASSGPVGKLVIAERSRCDAATFPLAYDAPELEYNPSAPETYWRTCSRNRDPSWNEGVPQPGKDFAQFSCDAATGTCPAVGPAHPTLTGGLDPSGALLRDHGLCELAGLTPADGVWRGMNHHSQFKCVQVTGTATEPYQLTPSAFAPGTGKYALNLCGAQGTREVNTGSDEQEPVLDCAVDDPNNGTPATVGFAALRYQPYGSLTSNPGTNCPSGPCGTGQYCDTSVAECKWILTAQPPGPPPAPLPLSYQGGCVNEAVEWGGIACPYPDYNRINEGDAFGRYSCYGDAPNCLWGAAGDRSVLILADTAAANDLDFCNNSDGKMNPCQCWR